MSWNEQLNSPNNQRRSKMKKTLIALSLIVIMLVAFAGTAMANAEADKIEAALEKVLAQFPQSAKQVSDAKTWLAKNGDDLKAGVGDAVVKEINAAISTAGTAKTLKDMSADQQKKILDNIDAAAKAAGLSASVSADGKTITIKDSTGAVISTGVAGNPVQQTGLDTTTIIIVAIGITVLFGAAMVTAVVTRKKGQPSVA